LRLAVKASSDMANAPFSSVSSTIKKKFHETQARIKTMALYLIGDMQGCDTALQHLLDTLAFSPSRDTLYLLGDLVNRGPDSAAVSAPTDGLRRRGSLPAGQP
jgi:hypothetical protein